MKKEIVCLSIFIALLVSMSGLLLAEEQNQTVQQKADLCLNESRDIMALMASENFNILRINDSIKEAEDFYIYQVVLRDKKASYNFSKVIAYCDSITVIREEALVARDEFSALLKFYNDSFLPGMNATPIEQSLDEIRSEINSERYENVEPLIQKTYNQISEIRAAYTTLNVFYANTTRSFKKFMQENWRSIVLLIIVLAVLYVFYRMRFIKWLINRKVDNLKLRKKTIKQLIEGLQRDYFQYGKIPESEYRVKTKKFAELIRDIDREVPLLQEQLAKIEKSLDKKIQKKGKK